jgi:hypothetical protein
MNHSNQTENNLSVKFPTGDTGGYISAFGYDKDNDWIFVSVEWNGTSKQPVGDRPFIGGVTHKVNLMALGRAQRNYGLPGAFAWTIGAVGNARLLFVPTADMEGEV